MVYSLTVDKIMSPKYIGGSPSKVRWSLDGSKLYLEWRPVEEEKAELYMVSVTGGKPRKLSKEEKKHIPSENAAYTEDGKYAVHVDEDNIYLIDMVTGVRRTISETSGKASDPYFTKDEKKICYTENNNLYTYTLEGGGLVQLTRFEPVSQKEKDKTDLQKWLVEQQKEFFDVIRKKAVEEEEKKEGKPEAYYLKPSETVKNMRLSHDETHVIFTQNEVKDQAEKANVPNYVTKSGFTKDIPTRLKVGDLIDEKKLGLLKVETGEVTFIEHGQGERGVELSFIEYSEDGTNALLNMRSLDFKDQWYLALDLATGKTKVLDSQHNDGYVKGRGSAAGYLNDNKVYYLSERDGLQHLYTVDLNGGLPVQITKGRYEISNPKLSKDKSTLYVSSSEDDLGERHFYSYNVDTWEKTKITSMEGKNDAVLSYDETKIAILHSYSNKPTELYVMENMPGSEANQLTVTPSDEWSQYPWIAPEIIEFTARDGVKVRARQYKPVDYNGGPAVIFVHGAGYMQNVHKWWSNYYREYMFHHLLMERGYMVLDIDYRASAGYGADWRTSIYRYMGDKDLTDQVDGARYLVENHGVDPDKIGIYGGSYGGFITLMALFTTPDVFKAGASLRPVTDWAHYNHGYTGSILNLPQNDDEAYRRSSPIYFAEGLKNHLLICHGMVDTNVHFQDTVRLAQRLIELRKENWEVAIYPVENHGFKEETSWADEFRRILKLYEDNLK